MTRRSRLRLGGPASVPVVLPHVIVRPDSRGTVAVTLDGASVSDGPIPRMQLGEALSQIVEQVAAAVRVEVHQSDGVVHADILTPPAHQPGQPAPPPARPGRRGRPSHAKLWGIGYEPGKAVEVGAVAATSPEETPGTLRVGIDPRLTRTGDSRVLAAGASSGSTRSQEPA